MKEVYRTAVAHSRFLDLRKTNALCQKTERLKRKAKKTNLSNFFLKLLVNFPVFFSLFSLVWGF